MKDNETNTNENEIKLNAEITNLKEQDASVGKTRKVSCTIEK